MLTPIMKNGRFITFYPDALAQAAFDDPNSGFEPLPDHLHVGYTMAGAVVALPLGEGFPLVFDTDTLNVLEPEVFTPNRTKMALNDYLVYGTAEDGVWVPVHFKPTDDVHALVTRAAAMAAGLRIDDIGITLTT